MYLFTMFSFNEHWQGTRMQRRRKVCRMGFSASLLSQTHTRTKLIVPVARPTQRGPTIVILLSVCETYHGLLRTNSIQCHAHKQVLRKQAASYRRLNLDCGVLPPDLLNELPNRYPIANNWEELNQLLILEIEKKALFISCFHMV